MNFFRFLPAIPHLLAALTAAAQTTSSSPPPGSAAPSTHLLNELVVTASPFARAQNEIVQPTSVLAGPRLDLKLQPSLGETLAGEPGISSTYFGPGASRPVIRGLGGDRIRVLSDGIGTFDASVVSPDHAVSIDPVAIDRIEIVRGPATLLYGGAAIGGVVNVIDSRIARELPAEPLRGRVAARAGSAADERSAAAVLQATTDKLVWHLDGFRRETRDIRVPDFIEEHGLHTGPLANTATASSGAAGGVSWITGRGFVGLAYSGFDSRYGVPGHHHEAVNDHSGDDESGGEENHAQEHGAVQIDLRQRRWDAAGEWESDGLFRLAKFQAGIADYAHVELEGDEIGTRFRNDGYEARVDFLHRETRRFEGAVGLQLSGSRFSATGDEAFLPASKTRNLALFFYEEAALDSTTWQIGGRVERQEIDLIATPDSRRHTAASASGGVIWRIDSQWSLAVSGSLNGRAPNTQELYANGPHAGTGNFERGDASLGVERSHALDLSLRRRNGRVTGELTAFANFFDGFVFEESTHAVDADSGLPVFAFVQRDARFHGGELDVTFHLHENSHQVLDVRITGDYVRAETRDSVPLPRITPLRAGVALDFRRNAWSLGASAETTFRQSRVSPFETSTSGHTLLGAYASWRLRTGRAQWEFHVRGTNLGDELARVHTSFLKDIAPLPGRNLSAAVTVQF